MILLIFSEETEATKKQPGHHHQIFKNRNSHILYTKHKMRRRKRQRTASGLRGRAMMMMITCYRDMGHAAGQGKRRRRTRTRRGLTAPRLPKVVQQIIVVFIVFFRSFLNVAHGYLLWLLFSLLQLQLFCFVIHRRISKI